MPSNTDNPAPPIPRAQIHQPASESKSQSRPGYRVAIFLTWLAGLVDAVGYLAYAKIYTANMSGNSVALGINLTQLRPTEILLRSWPILLYVLGLLTGRLAIEIGARQKAPRIASVAFGFEALLLGAAAWTGGGNPNPAEVNKILLGIALLALAMGIQNAALTRFSSLTLHTGFVTGTLVKFAEQFVRYCAKVYDDLSQQGSPARILARSVHERSFRISVLLALTWVAYVLGAIVGAYGSSRIHLRTLLIAIAGLVLLILLDQRAPLAIQEEKLQEQS
ncbi:MAG: DUF1275 domain-containing protein [Acidobacteriaceae bacterium]|nr:DUF1275 domain-containing protein [Acidobacteriaceae bacterium]